MKNKDPFFLLLFFLFALSHGSIAQEWKSEYDTSFQKGLYLFDNSQYSEAVISLQKAYEISFKNGDSLRIIESGVTLAEALTASTENDDALDILFILKSHITSKTPSGLAANISRIMGYVYHTKGEYELSNSELELAYKIADPVKDAFTLGRITRVLANGLIRFGEYDRGLELITESLQLFTSLNAEYYISLASQTKYLLHLYKGERENAEPYLFESCRLAEKLETPSLLRDCYYYLSDLKKRKNDYFQSITYSQKALQIAEQQEDNFFIIRFYNELGDLYLEIEEPDRALSYFNRAHSYYLSIDNTVLANQALVNIAECYTKKGDFSAGENILLRALEFFLNSDYHYDKGIALINLGQLKLLTNDQKKALEYLDMALEIGRTHNLVWVQLLGQELLLQLNDPFYSSQEKLALSKEVLKFSSKLAPLYYLRGLKNIAIAYSEIDSDSAFFYAETALELIEKKRLTFSGGTLKANVFSDHAEFYNMVGSWYAAKKKNYVRSFDLFEASKSRALLDQLAESRSSELLSLSKETKAQLLQLQKKTDQLYRQREDASKNKDFRELTDAITDAEFEYEVTLEKIRNDHPEWNNFIYPETLSLNQVQDLCDNNTAILEYALIDNGLSVLLITKKDVFYHEVAKSAFFRDGLTKQINAFRDSIFAVASFDVLETLSSPLYRTLLESFEGALTDISNLVIVPDGSIALLPFDALINNGQFLLKRFAIKTLPSVSVFKLLQNPHRETSQDILGIAGSGFEAGEGVLNSRTQSSFAALPYTLIEVDSISSKFNKVKVLKNELVTEAGLKRLELNTYKYLHFATHGDINETTPSQSGLILSKKTDMESLFGEDGYLNASEIASLSLNADLVVLSACNTATGKVLNGEGLLGLQRSFLIAGASSVVASLWSIYDRSTPLFMNSFYSKLIEYEARDFGWFDQFLLWRDWYEPKLVDYNTLALRDAKLEMLNHPYYNDPVHWASFVITGK
tara:strand:+ start:58590 stop:61517 length:2928 start_codon:yes stop_codon:yes gene_type:complete